MSQSRLNKLSNSQTVRANFQSNFYEAQKDKNETKPRKVISMAAVWLLKDHPNIWNSKPQKYFSELKNN